MFLEAAFGLVGFFRLPLELETFLEAIYFEKYPGSLEPGDFVTFFFLPFSFLTILFRFSALVNVDLDALRSFALGTVELYCGSQLAGLFCFRGFLGLEADEEDLTFLDAMLTVVLVLQCNS